MKRILTAVVTLAALSAGPALARGPHDPAPETYGSQVSVLASDVYSDRERIELGLKADAQITVTKGDAASSDLSAAGSR